MKVLFVDIDGPLVTESQFESATIGPFSIFNPKCVEALNDIWRFTSCELVISSDWTVNTITNMKEMRQYFKLNNVLAPIIGFTRKSVRVPPQYLEAARTIEINEWVTTHNPTRWVAIDDMTLLFEPDHMVVVDPIDGLAFPGLKDKIIELLNS